MMNKINELTDTINYIIANGVTAMVESQTEPKMNKRGNPFYGRVTKHTAYAGINFSAYKDAVNERREEEGKDGNFVPNASPYEKVNDFFVKKGNQFYLRFLFNKDIKVKSIYEVDGRPATAEEIEVIKSFMPSRHNASAHQGLSAENEVQMRVIKLENNANIGHESLTIEVA